MQLFDSHCHLDDRSYQTDFHQVLNRARDAGVIKIMTIGVNIRSSRIAVALAEAHPEIYAAVGIHPHDAKNGSDNHLDELDRLTRHAKVRAWGEVGLDFNRMFSPRRDQEQWLIRQLELSDQLGLPVIFHERDSNGRFSEILRAHFRPGRQGVVHCFSGTRKEMETYVDMGLSIGITGIVTIKGRGGPLRKIIPHIPIDRILIETDGPYLLPTLERNKFRRNEPAFVHRVLLKLAEVRREDPAHLARKIYENTCRVYRIETMESG